MLTRSAKNKGQRAAKEVRSKLLKAFPELCDGDILVTPSGVAGADILFSPRAQELLGDFDIEVKNKERFSVWDAIKQVGSRCRDKKPLLVFRRNRESLHVCLRMEDFIEIFERSTRGKRVHNELC